MSPALALGWYIWTGHRRGFIRLGIFWLIAMIVCRAVPDGAFVLDDGDSFAYAKVAFVIFCFLAAIAVVGLLGIFSFNEEVQLERRESSFPLRLRHLPMPTPLLVAWMMLWGSAAMILGWAMLAWAARRPWPWGFEMPLWWPGLLLAVVLAWLQAIIWTPFPLPWVRAFLLIPWGSVLVIPLFLLAFDVFPTAVCALLAALLPAAYWVAIRGVARARRGDEVYWSWPAWLRWRRTAAFVRPPFASAARAQLWFEWRQGGLAFPITGAAVGLLFFPFLLSGLLQDVEAGQMEVDSFWPTATIMLLLFWLMLASACGVVMGKLPGRKQSRILSSFLATRPLSVWGLVRAKFEAAALSTLAGWAMLEVGLLLWVILGGHFDVVRQHQSDSRFWASLVLLTGGALVMAWAQMAGHLWIALKPRAETIVKLILGFPTTLFLFITGVQVMREPQLRPTLVDLLPWLASGAIVLKCLAAAWSLSRLKQNALVPSHLLIGALVAWCTLALGLLAALRRLVPSDVVPVSGLVLSVVLLLPLTRLALAPLALNWNRHR